MLLRKFLCIDCRSIREADSPDPARRPLPSSAPLSELPAIPPLPNLNLDGPFSWLPLQRNPNGGGFLFSSSRPTTSGTTKTAVPDHSVEPVPPLPDDLRDRLQGFAPKKEDDRIHIHTRTLFPQPQVKRRKRVFATPELDMVVGKSPASAWHSAAMKVVAAHRFRRGMGHEVALADFHIDELGGRAGPLVFGPVAVFNGNVTMRVKKLIKDITVSITFQGTTEIDKTSETFFSVTRTLYTGDLHEGLRTFLFGFNFPHVNLPPTSEYPRVSYSFVAKLSPAGSGGPQANAVLKDYTSKPLKVIFIPFIDSALETPLVFRKPSMRKKKSKNGFKSPPSAHTLPLSDTSTIPTLAKRVPKPKLMLTTADLPSGSNNSTPIIDRPHPSMLSSAIRRTTRITDDDNETIAKLTVEMPNSRFLPGQDIAMKLTLQVRDGYSMPKGWGVRVIETRYLATEAPEKPHIPETEKDGEFEREDEDDEHYRMKSVGKEQRRVLTGKKFLFHPDAAGSIKSDDSRTAESSVDVKLDTGLSGGKEITHGAVVTLPSFNMFISESLLPTATLPLGDPRSGFDSETATPTTASIPVNGKGKNKAPESVSTTRTTSSTEVRPQELFFKVSHIIQITVPMGSTSWLHPNKQPLGDLDVAVPIIIGNKDPNKTSKQRPPELRLNAPDMGRRFGEAGSSSLSSRSLSVTRSTLSNSSDMLGPTESASNASAWREGERFLTMRETSARPDFVADHF